MSGTASRRDRLRDRLAGGADPVDALLVTSLVNVRYLSGFSGSNAALLVPTADTEDALLATDSRYVLQAAHEAPDVPLLVARACARAALEQAAGLGLRRVAVEAHVLTLEQHDELRRSVPGVELVPLAREVEALRVVKDAGELALLRTACEISAAALEGLAAGERWEGRSEREVAALLEHRMRTSGADGLAFDTIVGSGPNSAVPHHQPGERVLERGDLVVVDFGAQVGGYHADMTRTFVLGAPAAWQADLAALVAAAQAAGRAALTAGVDCGQVDRAARQVIDAAGHAGEFGHGTGHGVGLEIHEAPILGPGAPGRLAAAVPVTVEPGVYLPDRGGVRIEDTMVVTDGEPVALTTTSRELHVLG